MRYIIFSLCLSLFVTGAHAGAWSREKGTGFTATGSNVWLSDGAKLPVHTDPTLYFEYGLTDLVTIGTDYHTADQGRIHTGFIFARFPLGSTDGTHRLAANIGYGARVDAYRPLEHMVRGGLSWGRGIENGWLAIDATTTRGTEEGVFRPKVDATWGHNWTESLTTTIQLQTGQGFSDDYYAKINPNVIYTFREDYRVAVGAIKGFTGDGGTGIKVEIWTTF